MKPRLLLFLVILLVVSVGGSGQVNHFYKVDLLYDSGTLIAESVTVVPSDEEIRVPVGGYSAEVRNGDEVLYDYYFSLPLRIATHTSSDSIEIDGGGIEERNYLEYDIFVPYYDTATTLVFFDPNATELFVVEVGDYSSLKSINGETPDAIPEETVETESPQSLVWLVVILASLIFTVAMRGRKKGMLFFGILVCASMVFAVQPEMQDNSIEMPGWEDVDWSEVDFNNLPESAYNDPLMWEHIRWEEVSVDQLPADVYSNQLFYDALPKERAGELNYQLVDYTQIDQSIIDRQAYLDDMGCNGCIISSTFDHAVDEMGNAIVGQAIFSENGIAHPNGDFVSIPGSYPQGTEFAIHHELGIIILVPEDVTTPLEIPSSDSVTVETNGRNVQLWNGYVINGGLTFTDNTMVVRDRQSTIINGIEIFSTSGDVNVYFDGVAHTDPNYVAISPDGSRFYAQSREHMGLVFGEQNTILAIQEDDSLELDLEGANIQIISRDEDYKVPLVTVVQTREDGRVFMKNGLLIMESENSPEGPQLTSRYTSEYASSIPLEFTYKYNDGTTTSDVGKYAKSIDATFNRFIFTSFNEVLGAVDEFSDEQQIKAGVYYNYENDFTIANLKEKYNVDIRGLVDASMYQRLDRALARMTPEQRASFTEITVLSVSDMKEHVGEKGEYLHTLGQASEDGSIVVVNYEGAEGTIVHETTHTKLFLDEQEWARTRAQAKKKGEPIPEHPFSEFYRALGGRAAFSNAPSQHNKGHGWRWDDGSSEPRYGFCSAYGTKEMHEHLAECSELTYEEAQPLFDDSNEYHESYKRTFKGLCERKLWHASDCAKIGN